MRLFHAREPRVESAELVGKALMIDAEAVQDGRVQVPDVDGVFGDVVAKIVSGAVFEPGPDAASCEPD